MSLARRRIGPWAAVLLAAVGSARAYTQVTGEVADPYSSPTAAQYGTPKAVDLCDIARGVSIHKQSVRTTGTLDVLEMNRYWTLRGECEPVLVIPMRGVAGHDLNVFLGKEVEVTGVPREVPDKQATHPACGLESVCNDPDLPALPDRRDNPSLPRMSITMFSISDISPLARKKREDSQRTTLETLVKNPGSRDGKLVRVVGKFRGHNLYGDLPSKSQKKSGDWVIKDDLFAIWVTGKKSKGSGFDLDASLKRDTNKWLEVVGKPRTVDGVTYIDAEQVLLTTPPRTTAEVQPPPPLPERPKVPPVIVFALPLDGESDVASDSRFVIQFSKDMDESTFQGRVVLRYLGAPQPGDRPFDAVKLSYDGGRRALTIDPGDVLRPGRRIEILLLPGIADMDGLTLTPRPGLPATVRSPEAADAVDVLRFVVSS